MFKLLALAILTASSAASAQTDVKPSQATDSEKIADALRAGRVHYQGRGHADWPANPKQAGTYPAI